MKSLEVSLFTLALKFVIASATVYMIYFAVADHGCTSAVV
jgi:hypothetical protein